MKTITSSPHSVILAVAISLIMGAAAAQNATPAPASRAACTDASGSCSSSDEFPLWESEAIDNLLKVGDALCKETLKQDWRNPEKVYFDLAERYQGYNRMAGPYTGEFKSSAEFVEYASNPMVVATGCYVLGVASEGNHLHQKFPSAIFSYCWTGVIGSYDRKNKRLHRSNAIGNTCDKKEFRYNILTKEWLVSGVEYLDGAITPEKLKRLTKRSIENKRPNFPATALGLSD